MAGTIKKMNWGRTLTAYESMTAWRNKRKAFQEKYEANLQNSVAALQTAWNDVGYNVGEIAAKRALKRISDEAKVKQEALDKQVADRNNQPYQPTYSLLTETGSAELDGGSRVDLNSNKLTLSNGTVIDLTTGMQQSGDTLTLSDGTVIDLKTGMKKINVTV
jgi:bifunctional pyridoxal-dependent enzyme with beta-cystathionase and maltose regulon repressor activities